MLIVNEGALFRGRSRALPEEVWSVKKQAWCPYKGEVPKDYEWGTEVSQAEAEAFMRVESQSGVGALRDEPFGALATVLKAAAFAADKHRSHRRKDADASPYINHPLSLAHILATAGGISDPIVLSAALLHDTVEDTETTIEELCTVFGAEVAGIVAEVTDDKSLPKAERKRLQVVKSASKSDGAKLVKLADKISNLRDVADSPPADWSVERRQEYFDWAGEVVAGARGVNPSLERLFDEVYARRASLGS